MYNCRSVYRWTPSRSPDRHRREFVFRLRIVLTKALLPYSRSKHAAATPADSSSAKILGTTNPVTLNLQSFSAPVVFQALPELDGVDVVVGLNFLRENNIQVVPKDLAISIPMPDGPLLVKAAPQQPTFSEFSTDQVEVVTGARLARLVAREDGEVFIGYVKELNHGADTPESTAAAQPATFAAYESDLVREFGDVMREDVPPGPVSYTHLTLPTTPYV